MSISSTTLINTLPTLLSNNCRPMWVAYLAAAWISSLLRENLTYRTRGLVQSSSPLYLLSAGWDGGHHGVGDGLEGYYYMTWNTSLRYFESVNEHSIFWPQTPHKPTLPLLLLLLSKENRLRNGLLTYRFWVERFFGLEELKNNKHFFPISSNCWPSAEPLLPSATPQPLITVHVCSLYVICSWCYLTAFL